MIRLSCSTSRRRAHMNVGITHLERFTGKCPCKIQLAFHALTATCRGRIPNTGRSEWLVNLLVLFLQCGFLDDSRGGGVVLVESGQHAERWIHLTNGSDDLPGVADGVEVSLMPMMFWFSAARSATSSGVRSLPVLAGKLYRMTGSVVALATAEK